MGSIPENRDPHWLDTLEQSACSDDAALARQLQQLRTRAAVSLPILHGPVLERLTGAAEQLPYRDAVRESGKPGAAVYQGFGYCDAVPCAHPLRWLGAWFEARLRRALAGLASPPLAADFAINDVVCQRYRPGDLGITPHRDHIAYTGLVTLVVLGGRGRYFVCADRSGRDRQEIPAAPGRAILMPGSGYAGRRDRPFHMVAEISARRHSVGLRHDKRKATR